MNDCGAITATATLTTTNTDGSTSTSNHAVLLVPVDLVRETTPGSGTYNTLEGAPIFPADSGAGAGPSANQSTPKGMSIALSSDLTTTAVGTMTATIGGPSGNFSGILTETAANSGVFEDSANTVTVTLPVGTTTSSTAIDTLTAVVNSSSLGYSNATISMVESDVDSLYFSCPITSAEITFSSSYNPSVANTIHLNLQVAVVQGIYGHTPAASFSLNLTESTAGSGTFTDSTSGLTVTLTSFTGTNSGSVDSMVATFSGGVFGSSSVATTLTETTATSMDFTSYATTGAPSSAQGSDLTPDNPDTSGDGIFYLRVKGMSGPLSLMMQADLGTAQTVTLTASSTDPDTLISGKLLLVPDNATGTTTYADVNTLVTAASDGLGNGGVTTRGGPQVKVWIAGHQSDPATSFNRIGGIFLGQNFPDADFGGQTEAQALADDYTTFCVNLGIIRPIADTNLQLNGCAYRNYLVTNDVIQAALPHFKVFYLNCHGITLDPGGSGNTVAFQGMCPENTVDKNIYPSTIAGWMNGNYYDLVFLNGCGSYENGNTIAPLTQYTGQGLAMADSFMCRAYIGWSKEVNIVRTGVASKIFFTTLTGQETVSEAVDAVNLDGARYNQHLSPPAPPGHAAYPSTYYEVPPASYFPDDDASLGAFQFSDSDVGGTNDGTNWTATDLRKHSH